MVVYCKKHKNYKNTTFETKAYFLMLRQAVSALNNVLDRSLMLLIYQNRRKS
jgi:hypothetical protein